MTSNDQQGHTMPAAGAEVPVIAGRGRLSEMHARLLRVTSESRDTASVRGELRRAVIEASGAAAAAHVHCDHHGHWDTESCESDGPWPQETSFADDLAAAAQTALVRGATQIQQLQSPPGSQLVCAPVSTTAAAGEVLALLLDKTAKLQQGLLALELAASYQRLWARGNDAGAAQWKLNCLAAIVELVSEIERQSDVRSAASTIANTASQHVACTRAAVAVGRDSGLRLAAISGMSDFDAHSNTAGAMREALSECLLAGEVICWPPAEPAGRPARAHADLARTCHFQSVLSAPLRTPDGEVVGAWLLADQGDAVGDERLRNFVRAASPRMAGALETVIRSQQGPLGRLARSTRRVLRTRKGPLALAVVAILIGVMLLPVPYRVRCRCVVEPISKQYAVAPFDGMIEQGFVEPGDVVASGALLARLDGREIRWELASEQARRGQAAKKRDIELTRRDVPQALIAQLETERLDARLKLLRHRAANLDVTSPIEGVVLSGSLEKAQSAPVETGQVLYEIGPLSRLKVQLEVPAVEVAQISPGQPVKIWIDGLEPAPISGQVERLHPRSELRENNNVFVAELTFDNPHRLFRPGMRGSARISGPHRPLAWCLFHKPWDFLASRLTWW